MNYFQNHWLGKHSLTKSFWLNLVGWNLIYGISSANLISIGQNSSGTKTWLVACVLATYCVLLSVWQIVGTWRSATNNAEFNERNVWGSLTKFALFFASLTSVFSLVGGLVLIFDPSLSY